MEWMAGDGWTMAYGRDHGYLVVRGTTDVRLSRFGILVAAAGLAAKLALEATRTTIAFPLDRGPGRPGGEPELSNLMAVARMFAERFEAGENLEGYPQWQHLALPPKSWEHRVLDALHTIETEGL
jgi:hypothetical protein